MLYAPGEQMVKVRNLYIDTKRQYKRNKEKNIIYILLLISGDKLT